MDVGRRVESLRRRAEVLGARDSISFHANTRSWREKGSHGGSVVSEKCVAAGGVFFRNACAAGGKPRQAFVAAATWQDMPCKLAGWRNCDFELETSNSEL